MGKVIPFPIVRRLELPSAIASGDLSQGLAIPAHETGAACGVVLERINRICDCAYLSDGEKVEAIRALTFS